VELTGTDVQGRGLQVLQRADGMPIETRMQLTLAPRDDLPATEQRMDLDPLQRLESETLLKTYPATIQATSMHRPFRRCRPMPTITHCRRRKQALPWRERSNCTASRSAWRTAESASGRLPLRRDVVSC